MNDLIERQSAIDIVEFECGEWRGLAGTIVKAIEQLPSAQPELTDEQSIAHLQSSGWMQRHNKEMYESGLKKQLADDSDSYDSLLPTVQLEPHWIPCSERLPERADNVIICYKAGDYTLVSTGRYLYKFKMWYVDVVGDLRDGVTAWMSLPEPYMKEGDQ